MREHIISWNAPEYVQRHHSNDWYWTVGLVGIGSSVASIVFGNALFGIFLIVGTLALLLQSLRKPKTVHYSLSGRGIHVGKTLYPFSALSSFWITEDVYPIVLFKLEKTFAPMLTIPLDGSLDADIVREFLFDHLEEEELHEPLPQVIMEYLGF